MSDFEKLKAELQGMIISNNELLENDIISGKDADYIYVKNKGIQEAIYVVERYAKAEGGD